MKYDPKNMCYVDENDYVALPDKQTKTYDYEVTFRLVDGREINFVANDQPLPKREFIDAMSFAPFTLINEDSMAVNMRNVLYIIVKEKEKDGN